MSKKKDSLILYESFFDATADLSADAIAELWKAIGAYIKNEANEALASIKNPEAKLAWKFIKMQLDADRKKWAATCERRAEAGRLGGVKSGELRRSAPNQNEANASNAKQNEANEADTESESESDVIINNNNMYIRQQREEQEKEITGAFGSYCPSLPQIKKLDKRRLSAVLARYEEHKKSFKDFKDFLNSTFQTVEASDFLTGRSSDWQASFDWIFKSTNFRKIIEGNYKNREGKTNGNAERAGNRNNGTYNEGAADYGQLD